MFFTSDSKSSPPESPTKGGAAPPGQQPMWGEKDAQELRNGIHLAGSFPPHAQRGDMRHRKGAGAQPAFLATTVEERLERRAGRARKTTINFVASRN